MDNRFGLPTSGMQVADPSTLTTETSNKFGSNFGNSTTTGTVNKIGSSNSITDSFTKALQETIARMQFNKKGSSTTTTAPTFIKDTGSTTNTKNIDIQNMPPEALAALLSTIGTLQGGGTKLQQANIAKKAQTQQLIEGLLGNFTTGKAMGDAEALVSLVNLQNAERDRPQIQRAIEGAGTSGTSMQGLLAQNASRNAALASGALGAEQAKAYGGITAQLTAQLAQLANSQEDPVMNALISALGIAKGSMTKGSETNTTVNDLLRYMSGTSSQTNTSESGDQTTNTTGTTTTTGKSTMTGTSKDSITSTENKSSTGGESQFSNSSVLKKLLGLDGGGSFSSNTSNPNISWAGPEAPSQQLMPTDEAIRKARRPDGSIDWTQAAASLYAV